MLICFMATHHNICAHQSRTCYKMLPVKYYPTRCVLQTLHHKIFICSGRWATRCLNSIFERTTMLPDGSLTGFPPKKGSSIGTVSTPYLTDGGNV
ncbi:hypothetical protein AVEN_254743-1 [Araneus ventricosus]|uniref:Uncharacterized protein n=1 Tax=Araneus ventricosus TaxID=182803 RepID=A0A4Y2KCI0_ARAVE|nr:hypothetical protein AVEN_254743-1 [Araneus ventricosus]